MKKIKLKKKIDPAPTKPTVRKKLKKKKAVEPATLFTEEEVKSFKELPGKKFSIDLSPRVKNKIQEYEVYMVSFQYKKELSAFNIFDKKHPQEWQIVLLEEFIAEMRAKL